MSAEIIQKLAQIDRVELVCSLAAMFFFWLLVCGIVLNFILSQHREHVVKERRSPVATGAMAAFFGAMALLSVWHIGALRLPLPWSHAVRIAGCAIIGMGTLFNLWGRLFLSSNWGNQVRIYDNHTLVTRGPYAVVRHPLYASTIAMLLGYGLLQLSLPVIVCTLALFVPMMTVRARQEEKLLLDTFGEPYAAYCRQTGRFFPRIWRRGI